MILLAFILFVHFLTLNKLLQVIYLSVCTLNIVNLDNLYCIKYICLLFSLVYFTFKYWLSPI